MINKGPSQREKDRSRRRDRQADRQRERDKTRTNREAQGKDGREEGGMEKRKHWEI